MSAVEMDGDNGARAWRDGGFNFRRVNETCVRLDLDEDGGCAGVANRRRRGDEGIADGDDFVAGFNLCGEQREMQRARAGIDADAVAHTAIGCELRLEPLDLRAENELRRVEHARNRFINFRLDALVLRF